MTRATKLPKNPSRLWIHLFLAGSAIIFILLLFRLRAVLTPFVISFILAYLLDPLIDKLVERKIPRSIAILLFMSIILVIFIMASLSLFAYVIDEFQILISNLDDYMLFLKTKAGPWIKLKTGYDIPVNVEDLKVYFQQLLDTLLEGKDPDEKRDLAISGSHSVLKYGLRVIDRIFRWIYSVVTQVFALLNIIIVPIATFYLLKDIDTIMAVLKDNLPHDYKDAIVNRLQEIDQVLSAFIRGQLTVCFILGTLYSLGLLIVGVDFAVVIGYIAGLANIIPYFGLIVGIIPALILALLEFQDIMHPLMVIAVFAGVQTLEGTVITPKIVGEKVGLHPVLVMIAILIGGDLFGFLGILVAVPTAAVLMVLFHAAHEYYHNSTFYRGKKTAEQKE